MTKKTFHAYLDFTTDGACMAHILELPGCFVRADNRELALLSLSTAMYGYQAWLRGHGETPAPLPADFEIEVVAEVEGEGGLHRGGRVGLFAPEEEPVTAAEISAWLRLAGYNREELLALTTGWPDSLLDWRAGPAAMSIRDVLVHIGRADGFYPTRVMIPTPAPAARAEGRSWQDYLAEQRATAVARLQALTEAERSQIHIPVDREGDEGWTARKVLRRMVEHEREHMAHIHEILAAWTRAYWVRFTAERGQLLFSLLHLDEETLHQVPVAAEWTVHDILIHIGWWDLLQARRVALLASGRLDKARDIPDEEVTTINDHVRDEYQAMPLGQALAFCLKENGSLQAGLKRLAEHEWHEPLVLGDGSERTVRDWACQSYEHDALHGADIQAWRATLPAEKQKETGPLSLLLAAMQASRREMIALVNWVPEGEWGVTAVCGSWTLKDVLGHVSDWEAWGAVGLARVLDQGDVGDLKYGESIQAWNEIHAAARMGQSWATVWAHFEGARDQLLAQFARLDDARLGQTFMAPWGEETTIYDWLHMWVDHEREHAADLRKTLVVPGVPERLWVR